jgi:hypothetical protein
LPTPDSVLSEIAVSEKDPPKKKSNNSSLKWGLAASAGLSNINDGGFLADGFLSGVFTEEKVFVADVAADRISNGPPNVNAPAPIVYKPSAIEKGFSFSVGAFLEKKISKRFSVSTGLHYKYFSNSIQVGNRFDSSIAFQNFGSSNVNQFYRSSATTMRKYTNRYHFLDLPLMLNIQLNRSNRIPVLWNGGLSLSYLVSSNALHFDSRTGVYYKDNSLFNRLQANVSTGFSVGIFNKSKVPVHVGPQVQYGLTNLLQNQVSDNRHLLYFGLNTRFYLRK